MYWLCIWRATSRVCFTSYITIPFYNDSWAEFLNIHSWFKNLMWHFKPLLIGFLFLFTSNLGFPGGSVVMNMPAMQEIWVWSLGQADPLEKEMSTHSSFLAWKILRTEEPGRLQSMELPKSQTRLSDWTTNSVYLWDLQSIPIKMKLEPIIQSEVSQKEKHQYSILTHIYGI